MNAPVDVLAVRKSGFRDTSLRQAYDEAVAAFQMKSPALFDASGNESRTNSAASMFWRGYHSLTRTAGFYGKGDGTFGFAYWKAGRAVAVALARCTGGQP